jgi:hypothetical protein
MDRAELRDFWLNDDGPGIACRMSDGTYALLILGPSNSQVSRGDWRFGFQVHGEEDIRWLLPEQIERQGNALIEIK